MEHITSVNDVTTDENGLFGMMAGNETGGGGGEGGDGGDDGGGGGGCGGEEVTLKKGPWTTAEDAILMDYVSKHGEGNWNAVQRNTGLNRCGKSCRLRWANHLRPNLKKGAFSPEEEKLIIELHSQFGNKWARMAALLPGRTDNEIKNYMNTRIKRRQRQGLPLYADDHDRPTTPTTPTTPSPCVTPTGSNPNNTSTKFEFFHQQNHHYNHHPLSPTAPPHHHSPLSSPLQQHRTPHTYSPHTFLDTSPASALPLSSSSPSLSFTFQKPAPLLCSPLRFKRYRSSSYNNLHLSNPITLANNNASILMNSLSQSQSHSQSQTSLSHLEGFRFPSVQLNSNTYSQYFQTPLLDSSIDRGVSSSSSSSPFSTKLELPSNPYLSKTSEQEYNDPSFQTNSGLLGDLLIEAQALASGQNPKKRSYLSLNEGNDMFDGCQSLDDYPLYWSSNSEQKSKEEGPDLSKFMNDEDLSTLLTVMPSSTVQSEQDWQNNNSTQDISNNVQSSSSGGNMMTNDNFGLDVKPIASLFPLSNSTTNHNENTGCYTWDNLPGLC